jgi:hypothetical protein
MTGLDGDSPRYSVMRVFGGALWALRQRPGLLVGTLLLYGAVAMAYVFAIVLPLTGFDAFNEAEGALDDVNWPLLLLLYLPMILASGVLYVFYFRAVAEVLSGGHPTLADTLRASVGKALPFLALGFLWYLGWYLGTLLLIVPGLILLVRWSAALQAFANERLGIIEAFRRSARLTRGARWPTFGAILLSLLLFLPFFVLGFAFADPTGEPPAPPGPAFAIAAGLVSFAIGILIMAAMAAHYVELRRLEDARGGLLPA